MPLIIVVFFVTNWKTVTIGAYEKIAGTYQKNRGAYDAYHDKNLKGDDITQKFSNTYESPLQILCNRLQE